MQTKLKNNQADEARSSECISGNSLFLSDFGVNLTEAVRFLVSVATRLWPVLCCDNEAEKQHHKDGSGMRNWPAVALRENKKMSASTKLHFFEIYF